MVEFKVRPPEVAAFGAGIAAHDLYVHATEPIPPGQERNYLPTDRPHGWMVGAGLALLAWAMGDEDEDGEA